MGSSSFMLGETFEDGIWKMYRFQDDTRWNMENVQISR